MSNNTVESARLRVTKAMQLVTCALPTEEISRLAGVPHQQVKNIMARNKKAFMNVGTKRCGMYALIDTAESQPLAMPVSESRMGGVYTGERSRPIRAGADDFLHCGSVENGERIERRRPIIISTPAEQPRRYGP